MARPKPLFTSMTVSVETAAKFCKLAGNKRLYSYLDELANGLLTEPRQPWWKRLLRGNGGAR